MIHTLKIICLTVFLVHLQSAIHAEEKPDVNCQSNMEKQLPLEKSKFKLIKEIHDEMTYPKTKRSYSSGNNFVRVNKSVESISFPRATPTAPRAKVYVTRSKDNHEASDENTSFLTRVKNKLLSLSNYSRRRCAEGVRNILNTLFKKNVNSGPPAKKYNENFLSQWSTANSCYKESSDNGSSFKNYDIRVLQPKDRREAGHIEIFLDGRWYSDFKQHISLWNGGFSKYSSKKLYRYSNCSKTTLFKFIESIFGIEVIESSIAAYAEPADDKTPFAKIEEVLGESRNYQIKQVFQDQGTDYLLVKKSKNIESFQDKDSNSIYMLLERIKDKKLQKDLARSILETWLKKDGRAEVQKYILEFEQLTEIQKKSYIEAGLELPKKFEIYPK